MGTPSSQLYLDYQEMYHLRLASFEQFVKEPFEAVVWTDPATNSDTCTYQNWLDIKELWHREPCNIFWAGADTLMIQPTELFPDKFSEYRLFNYTQPRSFRDFAHHFNDDIQYYPHTMSADVWKLGEEWLIQRETHPDRNWGFDQLRHNAMFWSQDIPDSDRLHPEMAYQAMNLRNTDPKVIEQHNRFNSLPMEQAHILHFHGSRGSQAVVNIMKELCNQLGIQT
jgi:hypothetical protein